MKPGFVLNPDTAPSIAVELLYSLKVRDVMTTKLVCGTKRTPLRSLRDLMRDNNISGIPILEHERLVGIVSMEDLLRAMEDNKLDSVAEECMSRSVIALEDEMPVNFAISSLEKYKFGRFPVLNRNGDLVGILSSRDILTHLLLAMNRELEALEGKARKPRIASRGDLVKEFTTRKFDFERAGRASTEIKRLLLERGADPKTARRVAVASYELEMNQVVHSLGGILHFSIDRNWVEILAQDRGPGIPDLEAALTEGFSTANEWIRSLGFGAGMGLSNTKRVSDEFEISSDPNGTRVRVRIKISS